MQECRVWPSVEMGRLQPLCPKMGHGKCGVLMVSVYVRVVHMVGVCN